MMSSKALLITLGFVVILAIIASAEEDIDSSLSEEYASGRSVRDADPKRKCKKGSKGCKRRGRNKKRKGRGRKGNKKQNSRRPRKQNSRKDTRTIDGKCIENGITAMKRWKDQVANFEKQMNRVNKQAEIASKKKDKKAAFGPIALKLVDIGGGNKSALTCSGSADSDGAKQLTNLTQTLFDCEIMVNKSCNAEFPAPNMTEVSACNTSVTEFKTKAMECLNKSKEATAADACTCWSSEAMMNASEAVKSCKIKAATDVAKGLKACKEAFSKCRKFEDEAVSSMAACSKSVDKLKEKAATLSKNKAAMDDVKTKVAKTTGSRRSRTMRAVATTCAEFIDLVKQLVAIATDFPASPKIATVGADIVASADPTCTDDEKNSLKEQEAAVETAAAAVEMAYEEAQQTLMDATGSTASAAELGATTKAARLRVRDFQRVFN